MKKYLSQITEGNDPATKLRRSQYGILALTVIVTFLLLNATYGFVNLSSSALRTPILLTVILLILLGLSAIATIAVSYLPPYTPLKKKKSSK